MSRRILISVLTAALCWVGAALAQEDAPDPIEPAAAAIITEFAQQAGRDVVQAVAVRDTLDVVRSSGQKILVGHRRALVVDRPGQRLVIKTEGDLDQQRLYKDGETVTWVDDREGVYAQIPDPGTIDQMMDVLLTEYGIESPLADLLSADIEQVLTDHIKTAEVVGTHSVGGAPCHHLAVTQEAIDWQAWINAEGPKTLRKLVVTYKQLPGEPQYILEVKSNKVLEKVNDATFRFSASEDYDKIDFLPQVPDEEAEADQSEEG